MPRACTVCSHASRAEIDELLVTGTSYRDVAGRFAISSSTLHRHHNHIPVALARAKAARAEADADKLDETVRRLERRMDQFMSEAEEVMKEARASGDPRLRLSAIKEGVTAGRSMAPILELRGRVSGELGEKGQGQANSAPQVVLVLPQMVPKGDQRRVLTSEEARMLTAPASRIIDVQAEGSECAPAKEEIEQDANERHPGDLD